VKVQQDHRKGGPTVGARVRQPRRRVGSLPAKPGLAPVKNPLEVTARHPSSSRGSDLDDVLAWARAHPLEAYERAGLSVGEGRRSGKELSFLCCFHEETKPSLDVCVDGERAGLFLCRGCGAGGSVFDFWRLRKGLRGKPTRGEVVAFIGDMGFEPSEVPERVYRIADAEGNLVAEHHRIGDGPGKGVWSERNGQRHLGKGKDKIAVKDLPLYNLPALLKASSDTPVFVTEGEPAADALTARGLLAVATVCGASVTPTRAVLHYLKRFAVAYLWANAGEAGLSHMTEIAGQVGGNAVVLTWPGAEEGADAVQFFAAGNAPEDVLRVLRPIEAPEPPQRTWRADQLLRAVFPKVRWLVPNIIPFGLAILAGRAKVGKSWLTLQVAGAKGTGGVVLGEKLTPGRVLYLALEDGPRRLKDRMIAQGWQPTEAVVFVTEAGPEVLSALIREHDPELIIVDTLTAFYEGSLADQNDVALVSDRLRELHRLATDRDLALLIVDHHRKGATGDGVTDVAGSLGKGAVADTIISMYREGKSRDAKLEVVGRDVEAQEIDVRWDGRFACWQPVVTDGTQLKHAPAILEALRDASGGLTVANLEKLLEVNRGTVHRTLDTLCGTGRVSESGGVYYAV
jgi:hypothetical protein